MVGGGTVKFRVLRASDEYGCLPPLKGAVRLGADDNCADWVVEIRDLEQLVDLLKREGLVTLYPPVAGMPAHLLIMDADALDELSDEDLYDAP